jgi:hypothetical protein
MGVWGRSAPLAKMEIRGQLVQQAPGERTDMTGPVERLDAPEKLACRGPLGKLGVWGRSAILAHRGFWDP